MGFELLIAGVARDVAQVVAFGARMTWPGCRVTVAETGAEALARFAQAPPDLVVLDVAMPPPDGFEVCRRIRETSSVPIMMLTARTDTLDKVRALDLGADDYVTKPFDPVELLARMRALVRRTGVLTPPPPGDYASDDLTVDFALRQVRLHGGTIHLTSTEYRLLEELVRHAGAVLPHQYLLDQVWGPGHFADAHYLKVFVRRLRQKLGDDSEHPHYIQTEWGVGYRFVPGANGRR